jgi:nitrogen-specific signal transduction histidine kinase
MTSVYHSSGLGLWLVYWVVSLSDGRIELGEYAGGNEIQVLLPVPGES